MFISFTRTDDKKRNIRLQKARKAKESFLKKVQTTFTFTTKIHTSKMESHFKTGGWG